MADSTEQKRVAILGSTGSIGRQTIEVINYLPDHFAVEVLVCNRSADLVIEQAKQLKPNVVVVQDESIYPQVSEALVSDDIKVYAGSDAIDQVVAMDTVDVVVTAIVGYAGLRSTIAAIKAGKTIALANKETLVVAGELVNNLARQHGVNIFPVDSEHSAIFQCLAGEFDNKIEKIFLTASGGPFRGSTLESLQTVTSRDALKHPNWDMGAKITIDSATLMNKGLEVIEARWLFGVPDDQIEVLVHPQSIIHSMVQFEDGSVKAQLGLPDMKLPIQYALGYPQRIKNDFPRINFAEHQNLTFEQPDTKTFRNLALAYSALAKGGNQPCILNAANEVAVDAFLTDRIRFLEIPDIIEDCMNKVSFVKSPTLEDYAACDNESRIKAQELIGS